MRVRRFMLGVAVVLCFGATGNATIIIPTNLGNGADAELREFEANVDLFTGVALGGNRGGGDEMATRKLDNVGVDTVPEPDVINNYFPTNNRSSVMYLKFDVSSLPASGDSFWNDKQVNLSLFTRNTNQAGGNRLWNVKPEFSAVPTADRTPDMYQLMQFGIRGLEPGGTYADDDPNAANRTDRVGNPWTASQYQYDWAEGTGNSGSDVSGITFYNAPGITPHCVIEGSCSDANIPNSDPNSVFQTLGKTDDFDSNTRLLEESWHWPDEATAASYTTSIATPPNLAAGHPLTYEDPNGNLKQLLLDAKAAGRDTVTLMVYHNLDGTQNQPNVGIAGTTPNTFLNHNYLAVPKEFADDAIQNGLDNSSGLYSPQLRIFVPEPASATLLALGALAVCGLARRRK